MQFDIFLTQFIFSLLPHTPFFNYIFSFLSIQGNSILVWVLVLFAIVAIDKTLSLKTIGYLLLCTVVSTLFVHFILKNIFMRQRPSFRPKQSLTGYELKCPGDYSFPSGHATFAFSSAAVLAHFDKKRKHGYYLIASFISLSRIYLGCHYLFDTLAGGLVGIGTSRFLLTYIKSYNKFRRKSK